MIAVLVSDLHLSHQKPSIRADTDWYKVQAEYLKQLNDLIPAWDVPVICAGDVVDRWNQPPEFINWAIDHLPEMWTVAGQHDIPNHAESELYRSAFWTLVKVGKLKQLSEHPTQLAWQNFPSPIQLMVYGFGWEKPVRPPLPQKDFPTINLAVCHRYVWVPGKSYPDAPKENRLGIIKQQNEFKGYDTVLFGDNHQSWMQTDPLDNPLIKNPIQAINPGTFIRRKSDEIDHRPCVGLLKANGSIERRYLDVSGDRFVDRPEAVESSAEGLEEFVEGLKSLDHSSLDFRDAVRRAVEEEKLSERAGKLVLQAMEE